MKKVLPTLAVALIAAIGASSGAQAALIDFGVTALGGVPGVSYTGATLDKSSAFDLDGALLAVANIGSGDDSGLSVFPAGAPFNTVTVKPTDIMYGAGTGLMDTPLMGGAIEKMWTGSNGDVFTEMVTTVTDINRSSMNAITVTLAGTLTDTLGLFKGTDVTMIFSANQSKGPGGSISAGFTNSSSVIPEASTWVMMALGFIGLGYAAVRRSSKDRSALAV